MFLSGTLLNAAAVVVGATIGVLVGARMPVRLQSTLTDGLGLFTLVIGAALALQPFLDPATPAGNELAVLAALLVGAAVGELLNLSDRLDALGDWFQRRLSRGEEPSRISEGFVTASLVFCVGPLTILGAIQNGLTGDIQLLAVKSLLDGVASVAFAAALGAGVYRRRRPCSSCRAASPARRGWRAAVSTRRRSGRSVPSVACCCSASGSGCWR